MTESFYQLAGDLPNMNMATHQETYDDLGAVNIKVFHHQKKNIADLDSPIYAQFF
jgi:hypothetical protein